MHRGYVKLWRKTKDSFIWEDPEALKLWVHLLMEANHKNKEHLFNGKIEIIERGSLICGRLSLSAELGIHDSKIYRLLNIFEKEHLIEQRKTNAYTVISIVKYNDYQSNEQQSEQPVNNQRTTSEQPVNTPKELISIKALKKVDSSIGGADAPPRKLKKMPPNQEDVNKYCMDMHYTFDPSAFLDHYLANGWKQSNGNPITDWKAAVRNWHRRQADFGNVNGAPKTEIIVSPLLAEANRLAREEREAKNKRVTP